VTRKSVTRLVGAAIAVAGSGFCPIANLVTGYWSPVTDRIHRLGQEDVGAGDATGEGSQKSNPNCGNFS
jgi:hypothetical protein